MKRRNGEKGNRGQDEELEEAMMIELDDNELLRNKYLM